MKYFARGKFLFAGEYALLKGGTGLAAPTKLGQSLSVKEGNQAGRIDWKSISERGEVWFEGRFEMSDMRFHDSSDPSTATVLELILANALEMCDDSVRQKGFIIETELQFPKIWGIGSSSTLLSTIAQWLEVNPYKLNAATLNGSGYDLACADRENPILYKNQNGTIHVQDVELNWPKEKILFTHLGVKKATAPEVKKFEHKTVGLKSIKEISKVSIELSKTTSKESLVDLLVRKELLISKLIDRPPVQQTRFNDAPGVIASLGAWGGDFVMSIGPSKGYFQEKGYQTNFFWDELIIT